ncbi:MAG TPA: aromatic ring-hydroxylating dioxygenase subunit alpha [Solimonas sp.]|nr:aromatic ring-hydroxylating dioxygenase subunit alpha [Solimonas sp.]
MSPVPPEWLEIEPLESAHALAAPFYSDAEIFRLEQHAVFDRSWQLAADASALQEPGDHVVAEIASRSILLVRGADRTLRAFHNVCRHRAGPIALADGRGAKALHCKYHGWTYTLEGQLRSAPEMQGACDFDVSTIHLPQVQVGQWQSLVFVALDPEVPPLDEVLAGIAQQAGLAQPLAFQRRVSYTLDCNWKVYVDNFLEGYHLPHVHPALNKLLDYRSYTTTCARWHSLQHSPLEGADNFYGAGGAWYYFVYPNTMLNCLPGRLQTNRVLPLAVDRCRVDFDYWYPAGEPGAEEQQRRAQDQEFSDQVQAEDAGICAAVQRGLASGTYVAGRLCPKREAGVKHFHDLLRAAYRSADPPISSFLGLTGGSL